MEEEGAQADRRRIIITGGGTAGHIYPAVSIIEYIKGNYPGTDILFIGTRRGMEKDLIGELDIGFMTIRSSGLASTNNVFKKTYIYLRFFFLLVLGTGRSIGIIRRFKPDYVLGTGGYVCGPVFLGARLLGRRIFIHEQNFIPGRLNRFFAKYAESVFISFEGSGELFNTKDKKTSSRIVLSGNPVRKEIKDFLEKPRDFAKFGLQESRFTIVAFGGSLGAEKINISVLELYKYFRDSRKIQFLLICGQRFYADLLKKLDEHFKPADKLVFRLFPYIKDIEEVYRVADLVISRAGASTVAELAATGIPAILVPYPQAIANHQFYNAEYLVKNKKAMLLMDKDLDAESLHGNIQSLLKNNKEKYVNMKTAAIGNQEFDSEAVIVENIFGVN